MTLPVISQNLLVNPEFAYLAAESGPALYAAGWNTAARGDAEFPDSVGVFADGAGTACLRLQPGKRVWQFICLADLDENLKGVSLSLGAELFQAQPEAVAARLVLMGVESGEGTWSPNELGPYGDSRTFFRQGRGELIPLDRATARSPGALGVCRVAAEGLQVDWDFEHSREPSRIFRNAVGIQVEFENVSAEPVWIRQPVLVKGSSAAYGALAGRPLPDLYRKIPRTIHKLMTGKPVHVLTLGSSIDRGSANPRLYPYDENPDSPTYKQPLVSDKPFRPDLVNQPDLQGYLGWFQHYFMYTGRTRVELMKKFGCAPDGVVLNVMACDGSSIGESHSGYVEYTGFTLPPGAATNGHADGGDWLSLYPRLFSDGRIPAPDLVVFGSGHNERIDGPDEAAVFEGAIRWFQRHFPDVEFVNCMWIREPADGLAHSMPELAAHYGIPFLPVCDMIQRLRESCNYYALAPDGGHPQASAHYLWFKQLEKVFEVTSPLQSPLPQKLLPPRLNPYSYLWEGDMVTFEAPHPRIVGGRMMIAEDGPFNVWAKQDAQTNSEPQKMQILIDGQAGLGAGRGNNMTARDPRNSSFVYGRLTVGERHIFELTGNHPEIIAVDNKVALRKQFFPAGSPTWNSSREAESFVSAWGYPYGNQLYTLQAGQTLTLRVSGSILSVAWLDEVAGGVMSVSVDGRPAWTQATNLPFVTSDGIAHYIENRRPVSDLTDGEHALTIEATEGTVQILGVYAYTP